MNSICLPAVVLEAFCSYFILTNNPYFSPFIEEEMGDMGGMRVTTLQ